MKYSCGKCKWTTNLDGLVNDGCPACENNFFENHPREMNSGKDTFLENYNIWKEKKKLLESYNYDPLI